MNNLHKKSNAKKDKKPIQLTEERVKEIAKEEIIKFVNKYIVPYQL